jgi:AraC-like DNA-binding protein
LLGFSEPSALQHAFKRWYNVSAGSFVQTEGNAAPEDLQKSGLMHYRKIKT